MTSATLDWARTALCLTAQAGWARTALCLTLHTAGRRSFVV
jgi:uncharacterized membrane protein YidH (DUF202 family)